VRIGITDSGVGGLSVCAEVEAALRRQPVAEDVEILYLNAALEDDYSYNSMKTRREQLLTFDGFLRRARELYRPDLLFIACNTLSVLFEDPHFDSHRDDPILGIVDTGSRALLDAWRATADAGIIVFATEITVRENTYRKRLLEAGVPAERIVQQGCPGLPDAISNDLTGGQAAALLADYVPTAIRAFEALPPRLLAFLGCTHYGYHADRFETALRAALPVGGETTVQVLNPNPHAARYIVSRIGSPPGGGRLGIRFVTRYAVPEKPLASLPRYLGDRAPLTVSALLNYEHRPDFFARFDNVEAGGPQTEDTVP